jgi:hypothetical protein
MIFLLASACGGGTPRARFDGQTFARGAERFHVEPPQDWERVQGPEGDLAFRDPRSQAVIAANATCRGHHDPPLSVLVNDLLIGTTARSVLLEETLHLDGREARHEVVALRLDGVPLIYDVYVMKKDGCVYDLTLISRPRAYDTVADQFVAFVSAFRAAGQGPGE